MLKIKGFSEIKVEKIKESAGNIMVSIDSVGGCGLIAELDIDRMQDLLLAPSNQSLGRMSIISLLAAKRWTPFLVVVFKQ